MFLKNKNIIFKIRRSKVTDYAALKNDGYPLHTVHRAVLYHFGTNFRGGGAIRCIYFIYLFRQYLKRVARLATIYSLPGGPP